MISRLTEEVEVGKIYHGHRSENHGFRRVRRDSAGHRRVGPHFAVGASSSQGGTDEVAEGDQVMVKVLEVDKQGKIRLSRKESMPARRTAPEPAGVTCIGKSCSIMACGS